MMDREGHGDFFTEYPPLVLYWALTLLTLTVAAWFALGMFRALGG